MTPWPSLVRGALFVGACGTGGRHRVNLFTLLASAMAARKVVYFVIVFLGNSIFDTGACRKFLNYDTSSICAHGDEMR